MYLHVKLDGYWELVNVIDVGRIKNNFFKFLILWDMKLWLKGGGLVRATVALFNMLVSATFALSTFSTFVRAFPGN